MLKYGIKNNPRRMPEREHDTELDEIFVNLKISGEKKAQLLKKPQILKNLFAAFHGRSLSNRLLYMLACTASKRIDINMFADLIERRIIEHENMLKECLKYANRNEVTMEDMFTFVKEKDVGRERMQGFVKDLKVRSVSKNEMFNKVRSTIPCADFKAVVEEIERSSEDSKKQDSSEKRGRMDWLEEGEMKNLFKPGENPQISEDVRQAHLKRTGGKVVTRFPPEPNGHLHIGHAKAINLNFEYAKKFGGYTYLRYDDTNPKNEMAEYFDSIYEDVLWLGFKPYKVTASSDYFEKMIVFSFELIKRRKAYVCHLNPEEMCSRRRQHSDSNCVDATCLSPYRDRSVEENLKLFQEMLDGKWEEGKACLRFKMDTDTKNPLMFDLVAARVIDAVHPKKNIKYTVYPTYELALCCSDSIEDVTHSFCTREFYMRRESYNWVIDQLGIYKPVQLEFSRLSMEGAVLSKRKILPLIKHGMSFDDPRLYTIKGMRRRGFPQAAINRFCRSVGLTFSDVKISVGVLENFVRDDLNRTSRRMMCVKNPLKVTILDVEKCTVSIPDFPKSDLCRDVPFTPVIYIEKTDFMECGDINFLRLTPKQPVGLYMLYAIEVVEITNDGIIAKRSDAIPKKFIHWVSEDAVKIEMRLYSPLFMPSCHENDSNYFEDINKNSLEVCYGLCDKRILDAKAGDKFQFQRLGYFCVDKDTTNKNIVVNLTVPLRNVV